MRASRVGWLGVGLFALVGACRGEAPSSSSAPAPIATTTAAGPELAGQTTTQGARLLTEVQRRFLVENTPITRSHKKKSPTKPSTHPTRPVVAGGGVESVFAEAGGFRPRAAASKAASPSLTAILPPLADGSLAVEAEGMRVRVTPRGFARSAIQWAQNVAVYPDVAPGVHAFRRTTGDGVEDFYEVFTASELLAFRYDVTLAGVAGLRVIDGSVELLDAGGAPRLRVPTPVTYDSAGVVRVGTADIENCAVDRDPRGPWGRKVVPPGGATCTLVVRFDARGLRFPVLVDPAWVSTKTTTKQTHADHQLLALPAGSDAGKILLVGGTGTVPTVTELYDPATDTWAAAGSLPIGLGAGMNAAVLPNGQVVAGGGIGSPSTVLVRSTTGAWSAGAAMNARAYFAIAATKIDGKDVVFVAGGQPTSSLTSTTKPIAGAQYYDPVADSWTTLPSMTTARAQIGSARLGDGRILLAGGVVYGSFGSDETAAVEVFDPTTKAFSSAGLLSAARANVAVVALAGTAGRALLAGGDAPESYGPETSTVEYFDGSAFTTLGTTLSEPKGKVVGARLDDGRVLFTGGEFQDSFTFDLISSATSDIYDPGADPKTGKVSPTVTLKVGRSHTAAVTLGTRVLVAGGKTADLVGAETTEAEIYDATLGKKCTSTVTDCPSGLTCTEGVCCKSGSCPEGQTCAAPGYEGVCTKPKGTTCTSNSECATGFCVTGVCCATACTGSCQACNDPTKLGECTSAKVGTDPKGACGGDKTCGPFCDSFGDCYEYAAKGTKCGASASGDAGLSFCSAYACNDFGDCNLATYDCGLTCTTSVSCDEATKTCTASATGIKAGYCVIDAACWSYGDINPKDACLSCDPVTSKTTWTAVDGCADGGVDGGSDTSTDTGVTDTGATDTGTTDTGARPDTGTTSDTGSIVDAATETGPGGSDLPEASGCGCETAGAPSRGSSALGLGLLGLALGLVRRGKSRKNAG